MGRLEIQIKHYDHNPGPSGAVIALAVVIVLAVVGGAGHHVLDNIAHTVLTFVEIAASIAGGIGFIALAFTVALAVARRRAARPRPVRVESIRLADSVTVRPVEDTPANVDRPAVEAPRRRPDGWPLSGQWAELPLDDPRPDGPARYS
jgi:hypothetical protein